MGLDGAQEKSMEQEGKTEYTYIQEGTPDENQKYCFITYDDVNNAHTKEDQEVTQ